jgi:hypothetical protein
MHRQTHVGGTALRTSLILLITKWATMEEEEENSQENSLRRRNRIQDCLRLKTRR